MRYKKTAALLLAFAMLAANACASVKNPENTPEPTAETTAAPTEKPTEKPTAVPTEAPTAEPTEAPMAVPTEGPTPKPTGRPTAPPDMGEMPDFPSTVRLGNLIGGELFPEPAKYLVIPGESGLHYVYDNRGELVDTFLSTGCMSDADGRDDAHGFYGEYGICHGYRLKDSSWALGEIYFQGNIYRWQFDSELYEVRDAYFENPRHFSGDPDSAKPVNLDRDEPPVLLEVCPLGLCGCIFKLDDRYLAIEAWPMADILMEDADSVSDWMGSVYAYVQGARLYDEELCLLNDHVDTKALGRISGVFGDRYIYSQGAILTLDGEKVMENVELIEKGRYSIDVGGYFDLDELYISYIFGDCIVDENGVYYDRDLNIVDSSEAEKLQSDSIYEPIIMEDRAFVRSGVYAGIKNGEGNWLFRIYDPRSTFDSVERERWPEWFWRWYWENGGE